MFRFLPWRFFVKWAARRYGVLDPATLLARLRQFSQPSEVAEPLELLRAGIVFHARGLVNSKAIQHNLDWVWPYWVERQFNPNDPSFIPRAFSFSHINLSHRNWTAVGLPGVDAYPIVDPRGLVTPLYDGWSLDFWIVTEAGNRLLPSKLNDSEVCQELLLEPAFAVRTRCNRGGMELDLETSMTRVPGNGPEVQTEIRAESAGPAWLAVAVRPYNPEGVQFINRIERKNSDSLRVNDEATVKFDAAPETFRMAHYAEGDVYLDIHRSPAMNEISCGVGMATAAALFPLQAGVERRLAVRVSLERDIARERRTSSELTWENALKGNARLEIADSKMAFLHDAAVRTLLLLSANELVPGPYTYRRFWFRDACLMLHPLLLMGQQGRARRVLSRFASRQTRAGYFSSQDGEWDSNGQVLWIVARYAELTGESPDEDLNCALSKGVTWLAKKRISGDPGQGTRGLLPAGFSAEHLGPNDFYYWDDFWAWAGLAEIAKHWRRTGNTAEADRAAGLAEEFRQSIEDSIATIPASRAKGGIPAAPGRRLDAGAIGSMVADYPLQLYPPGENRLMATAEFLKERCFVRGGFFQEMIHSGINAYLTLDLAQTFLRAGDPQFANLIRSIAALASSTGQWPEAIHPQTLGGCMGDGQHGWAAAEWIMMIRNCFVREEDDALVLCSGILPEWLEGGAPVFYGPTLTRWGQISVRLDGDRLEIDAKWRAAPPPLRIRAPGFQPLDCASGEMTFQLSRP